VALGAFLHQFWFHAGSIKKNGDRMEIEWR
jgi:hypothetical protein